MHKLKLTSRTLRLASCQQSFIPSPEPQTPIHVAAVLLLRNIIIPVILGQWVFIIPGNIAGMLLFNKWEVIPLDVFVFRGVVFPLRFICGGDIVHHPCVFFSMRCCSVWLCPVVRAVCLNVARLATSKTDGSRPFLTSCASRSTVSWPCLASFKAVRTVLHHRWLRM